MNIYILIFNSVAGLFGIIYLIKQYNLNKKKFKIEHPDKSKGEFASFANKNKFTLIIFFLVIISLGFIVYNVLTIVQEKTIVVLLPFDDSKNSSAYEDGERQGLGLLKFTTSKNEDLSNFKIKTFNHAMDVGKARKIVIQELKRGSGYFLCTMSSIGENLSKNFTEWAQKYAPKGIDPKLILTVASSPNIEVKENSVYRFYIRSEEEGKKLANAASSLQNIEEAFSIAVKDAYGKGAVTTFKQQWEDKGKIFIKEFYFEAQSNEEQIINILKINKNLLLPFENKLVFIANYGGGLDKTISALHKLGLFPLIVATSTLSIDSWQKPVADKLKMFNWITCVPKLKDKGTEIYKGDVVRDFVYFSLDRLIKVLDLCDLTGKSFHAAWMDTYEPKRLDYTPLENGDTEFKLICDQHFNLVRE